MDKRRRVIKKTFYYSIQWTWGILMNLIGLGAFIIAKINKWPIENYRNATAIYHPTLCGGMSLGSFLIIGKGCKKRTASHEYGHSIQNMQWGPLMPFVIGIPTIVRYCYRKLKYNKKNLAPPTKYEEVWFEKQATEYGRRAVSNIWSLF
jgi:hypothetical protein